MTWALQVPGYWPWLLALPGALALGAWWWRRAAARTAACFGPRVDELCGPRAFVRTRACCAALAVAAFALALLRPVTPGRDDALRPDVVLCVDVSRSMDAADGAPTRFASLRRQLDELLDAAVGSRVALLAFAGDARVVAPLTADRAAVAWLLDELAPGAIARAGTDLGGALRAAAMLLERAGAVGEVVVLSDGEDFGGDGAAAAAALLEAGHRVHCFGYGSEAGSKIVVERDGAQSFLVDANGDDVVTRLAPDGLRAIAAAGGGSFAVADGGAAQLASSYHADWVPHAARRRMLVGDADVAQRFAWPLLVGVLLWMLRLWLPERRT